jgi:hypothetical protein
VCGAGGRQDQEPVGRSGRGGRRGGWGAALEGEDGAHRWRGGWVAAAGGGKGRGRQRGRRVAAAGMEEGAHGQKVRVGIGGIEPGGRFRTMCFFEWGWFCIFFSRIAPCRAKLSTTGFRLDRPIQIIYINVHKNKISL